MFGLGLDYGLGYSSDVRLAMTSLQRETALRLQLHMATHVCINFLQFTPNIYIKLQPRSLHFAIRVLEFNG